MSADIIKLSNSDFETAISILELVHSGFLECQKDYKRNKEQLLNEWEGHSSIAAENEMTILDNNINAMIVNLLTLKNDLQNILDTFVEVDQSMTNA